MVHHGLSEIQTAYTLQNMHTKNPNYAKITKIHTPKIQTMLK